MSLIASTPLLETDRLRLEPLRISHADEMVGVLGDAALYEFTGGEPPSLEQLQRRYTMQCAGSRNKREQWHNWVIRHVETNAAVGFVQATMSASATEIAWTIGVPWQGNGYAKEAARLMSRWLMASGVTSLIAWIHPDHVSSQAVAAFLGLRDSLAVDDDGEHRWDNLRPTLGGSGAVPVVVIEPEGGGLLHDG